MADFYIRSAVSLDRVLKDECSVKAAAASHPDSGRVLAILVNSLAYRSALMLALEEARVLKNEEKVFTLHSPPNTKQTGKGKGKGKENGNNVAHTKGKPFKNGKERVWPSKEAFLLVLCHDLLFQSRGIQASKTWPPKITLERYKPCLHSCLVKVQIRSGKSRITDLRSGALFQEMSARIPRWMRINTLRSSAAQVDHWLAENRYIKVSGPELGGVREYMESPHVPGLLAFHPKATSALLGSEVYKQSWVVMQDLASCFPAYILLAEEQGVVDVVDATSAPGNKTCHLSAIMLAKGGNQGRVYAFERDRIRYKTLVKRLSALGALAEAEEISGEAQRGNVVAHRKDFLTTRPDEFSRVTHMLVDPSCSGSGIVNRLDFLKEDEDSEDPLPPPPPSPSSPSSSTTTTTRSAAVGETGTTKLQRRLTSLSDFQLLMLRHAFKFPSLIKLVYSTCSIHAQENEAVVLRALDTEEAKRHGWKLAPRKHVIPNWQVRGDPEACKKAEERGDEVREGLIRCVPGGVAGEAEGVRPRVDCCNGFFVACFIRDRANGEAEVAVREGERRQRTEGRGNGKREREAEAVVDEGEDNDDDEEEEKDGKGEAKKGGGGNTAANRKKKLQKKRKKQRLQQEQHQ